MKKRIEAISGLFIAALFIAACGPNEAILNSNSRRAETPEAGANPSTAPEPETAEKELERMRTAGFDSIYIFRRKDGREFDSEDTALIRTHTAQVNRRVLTDERRAIVVGTNYPIAPDGMKAMKDRFVFEDHSKPKE